jgi:capsular exopolysaccharide synthesis family protein
MSEIRRGLLGAKTPFVIKESYKAARTSMSFAVNNGPVRTVVLSSCEPDAGKSTTCTNLAITMSKTNAKVLIVDADLRKPIQHKYFRIDNSKGLSGVLAGHYPASECLYEVATNLYVMPSGVLPPNPSELIAGSNMDKLIKQLSGEFDYVFFDAPPAGVVTDSVILAPKTDGMLFVVRQNQSEYPEIRKVIDDVEHTDGKVIGAVITDVRNYNSFGTVKYKAYDYKYGGESSKSKISFKKK